MSNKKNSTPSLKPAHVLKSYWSDNARFADLFNQVCFEGNKVILPEYLSEQDTEESAIIKSDAQFASISRTRDIIKQYAGHAELVLIGVENQMNIHYAMPVRSMTYDALAYVKQCRELEQKNRKEKRLSGSDEFLSGITKYDRIKPVITLVIYYGEKPWDGSMRLRDMMDIPTGFEKYYNDYRIQLLEVRDVAESTFEHQDNQSLFTMLNEFYSGNKKFDLNKFGEKHPELGLWWESLAAFGAIIGSNKVMDYACAKEGGEVTMWALMEQFEKESEEKGLKRGLEKGLERGLEEGRKEGIQKAVIALKKLNHDRTCIIQTLKEVFDLTEEEVQEYLDS